MLPTMHVRPAFALSQIDEDKEAKKMAAARAVLAGRSFTEGEDDPFEGLGPQEIQAYIDKALEGISHTDPFEVCCIQVMCNIPCHACAELCQESCGLVFFVAWEPCQGPAELETFCCVVCYSLYRM